MIIRNTSFNLYFESALTFVSERKVSRMFFSLTSQNSERLESDIAPRIQYFSIHYSRIENYRYTGNRYW